MGIMAASETTQNICVPREACSSGRINNASALPIPESARLKPTPGGANGSRIGERRVDHQLRPPGQTPSANSHSPSIAIASTIPAVACGCPTSASTISATNCRGEAGYRHMTRRIFPRQMHTEQPTGKSKQGVQPQRCRNSFEDASPEELGKN